jgi:hypothetical protein
MTCVRSAGRWQKRLRSNTSAILFYEDFTLPGHRKILTTLIALCIGKVGDGSGSTEDMVKWVQERSANFIHLDTRKLNE